MKLRILRAAEADLDRIGLFLERNDPRAAVSALKTIRASAETLLIFPDRAPLIRDRDVRRLPVPFGGSGYLIDYRVDRLRGTITIIRIRHGLERR